MKSMDKKKILIVEDEPAIAEDLMDILELEGFQVSSIVHSYDQALSVLAIDKPDLIFLDIALKGRENGMDVAEVINEKFNIPFIFLTSFSDAETIKKAAALKPSGYLVKPFKERDIAPLVAVAFANQLVEKKDVFPDLQFINQNIENPMTKQEYLVLSYIWEGKQNKEIASFTFTSINTVKSHANNLYRKLNVKSRAEALNKVINM